ncbi:MAG: hypothetical protein UCH28_11565, partial [Adlercreutzia sp.]|nr:hypothetical protein [Adlercreutzia sp.]
SAAHEAAGRAAERRVPGAGSRPSAADSKSSQASWGKRKRSEREQSECSNVRQSKPKKGREKGDESG